MENSLKELAEKHNFTTGKWIFFVPWTEADEAWKKLVYALLDGKFSDDLGVLFVRVHGRDAPERNPHSYGT
jgi:hypothetical protein